MEPVQYLRIVRRRWWAIGAAVLIAVVAVLVTTPDVDGPAPITPVASAYEATHVLLRQPDPSRQGGGGATQADLSLTAFYVTAGEVPKRVAAKLGVEGDPAALAARVRATAEKEVPAIRVAVTDPDGARAAQLADTFAGELLAYLDEVEQARHQRAVDASLARAEELQAQLRRLERALPVGVPGEPSAVAERDAVARQYGNAYERYQQLVSTGPQLSGLVSIQPASPIPVTAGAPSFRPPESRTGRLLIVGSLGLLIGVGGALLIDRLDRRPRNKEEAEAAFGLPIIAEVPALPRLRRRRADIAVVVAPHSMTAEAYRMLRTALLLMPHPSSTGAAAANGHSPVNGNGQGASRPGTGAKVPHPKVILVTSPGPGEGKTTSVANLAAALAEIGQRVLVLNYDLRCPRVHKFLGLEEGLGLTDVLSLAPDAPDLGHVARLTDVPGVRLVSAGTRTDASESLLPAAAVVAEARALADVVLIDSSPLLTMSDASELVPSVDAVLLVARAGATGAEAAARATELLGRLGAPVTGVALVGVRELPGRPRGYYHEGVPRLRIGHGGDATWPGRPVRGTGGVKGGVEGGGGTGDGQDAAPPLAVGWPRVAAAPDTRDGDLAEVAESGRSAWPRS